MQAFDLPQLLAIAAVLGFASGIRLYAVLAFIGLAGWMGWVDLPTGLQLLADPRVLAATASMTVIEFFADKIPALDSLWDAVHTLIRIPAGAALAAATLGGDGAVWATIAALLGGSLAATSHFTKAGSRAVLNTSPEPFTNLAASATEDFTVGGLLLLVLLHPFIALAIVVVLIVVALWLLPKLMRFIVRLVQRVGAWFVPARG
jgi:Domain of unknown function (DUF4126)